MQRELEVLRKQLEEAASADADTKGELEVLKKQLEEVAAE